MRVHACVAALCIAVLGLAAERTRGAEADSIQVKPSVPETQIKQDTEEALEAARTEARKLGIELPPGWLFVLVKPGRFVMGSPASESGRDSDEQQHEVILSKPFWMSAHETTQTQYEELMGRNPSHFKGAERPVEKVSWDDAQDFIRALNKREREAGRLPEDWTYRLPTEAEWEYACRGGSETAYCHGNGVVPLMDHAWYAANSALQTHPVGQKKPNPWGLYDMHGNVWEWCQDWYGEGYYGASPATDPTGPTSGAYRVIRGSSWRLSARLCRSASRSSDLPDSTDFYYGFRLVLCAR